VVYVNDREITEISAFMEIPRQVFVERCLYVLKSSHAIKEADDGRCIFFENGCAIYPVRPLQCRTFPFWFQNMRSLYAWKGVAAVCPGIGKGHLYSKEAILECIGASYPIYEILVKEVLG
jgi:Fe-S-cluster containining protein